MFYDFLWSDPAKRFGPDRIRFRILLRNTAPRSIILRGVKNGPGTFLQKYQIQLFFSRIRIHIYFCDTVPLKACVKVLRNCSTLCSMLLGGD